MKNLKKRLSILGSTLLLAACMGNQNDDTTSFKGGGGSGGGTNPPVSKPSEKVKEAALKENVFINFESSSELLAVKDDTLTVRAMLKINRESNLINWTPVWTAKVGEGAQETYKDPVGSDLSENLRLHAAAYRFEKDKKQYWVLLYQLERGSADQPKGSQFLVLVNPLLPKKTQAFMAFDLIYPLQENIDLKAWGESKIPKPKSIKNEESKDFEF